MRGDESMRSKWQKQQILELANDIRNHLPECKHLSKKTLFQLLSTYRFIFVKPDNSSMGYGILSITKRYNAASGKLLFRLQNGSHITVHRSFAHLYEALRKQMKKRPYLLQKGIDLLKHRQRPFDVRVMVQKNERDEWLVSGIVARKAPPKKMITNISAGGTVHPLHVLLHSHLNAKSSNQLIKRCGDLALKATRQLQRQVPNLQEAGVDIGIDRNHRLWILEVNTRPDITLFTRLSDQTMLKTILQLREKTNKKPLLNS